MNKLVVASVAASVPIAPVVAEQTVDPFLAALDLFRRADVDFYANKPEWGGDIPDDIGDRYCAAVKALVSTRPTSPVGLAALTCWARDQMERKDRGCASVWESVHENALVTTMDDATRGMSGLQPWTPPNVAGEDSRDADPTFAAIAKFQDAKKKSRAAYARVRGLYKEAAKHGLGDESPLKDRNDFVEARLGCHPDEFTDGPAAEHWHAADDVFSTVPTTKPGIVALLRFAADLSGDKDDYLVEDNMKNFVSSLNAAAKVLLSA